MQSVRTDKQERTFRRDFTENGDPVTIIATVRYDDRCKNGHNTFSITGDRYEKHMQRGEPTTMHTSGCKLWLNSCGCIHEDIAMHFPELAPLVKWHLCSSDGPLHYVANTTYHTAAGNIDAARNCAVWPDATLEQLRDKEALAARLPALLDEFRAAVESLGFTY